MSHDKEDNDDGCGYGMLGRFRGWVSLPPEGAFAGFGPACPIHHFLLPRDTEEVGEG